MPQSYSRIVLHTTFSTKYRQAFIDLFIESELYAILCAEAKRWDSQIIEIGGTEDHIHIIHTLPRTRSVADVINAIKSVSSKWIKTKGERYEWFFWQDGYGTFSVDYRKLNGIREYVRHQKEHHSNSNLSFEDEYTEILTAYGHGDFNPAYQFPTMPGPEGCLG